ncbi:MAG: hypothetical protein K2O18_08370 [Oscillospiraceae bacterium]|nr:hypothetical protein [Oscillospiraceae bacterium]
MRQRKLLTVLLALILTLLVWTGCSAQTPDTDAEQPPQAEEPSDVPLENPDEPDEPEPNPLADALGQYRTIISRADTYDYGSLEEPTGVYHYALVRMMSGTDVPALLLEQETSFGICTILVFQYDADSGTVLQADSTLQEGAASAGGYRGGLSAAGDGNGLLSTEFSSANGRGSTVRITLDGAVLQSEIIWEGNVFEDEDPVGSAIGFLDIGWHDSGDTAALDSWAPDNAPSVPAEPEPAAAPDAAVTDGDRIVFTGTIGLYTYEEVLALQEIPDPSPGYSDPNETFRLIILDTPQNMTLLSGDGLGFREDEASMINVTGVAGLEQYDGQTLMFSIDRYNSSWPSDVSLPVGQPSTGDVHILG